MESHDGERTAFPWFFLLIGWVGEDSASLKPFCEDLVSRADEYHLLVYFLPIISYEQRPGALLAPGSATFLVQGLFLQPPQGHQSPWEPWAESKEECPYGSGSSDWREAFSLHPTAGSGIAMPCGDLVPNPRSGFCSKDLEQWEEVLRERAGKSWYHPRGAHSCCPCFSEEPLQGKGGNTLVAVAWCALKVS